MPAVAQQLGGAAGREHRDAEAGSPRANSTSPVLSETLISAVLMMDMTDERWTVSGTVISALIACRSPFIASP